MNSHNIEYYKLHSEVSDPGKYTPEFAKLPQDIKSLGRIVQGLMIHETDGSVFNTTITPNRIKDIRLRYVNKIVDRLFEIDNSPLEVSRDNNKKIVGTCRDFAILLTSMCRSVGIAARMRVGFASYTYKDMNFNPDHVLMEYWNNDTNKWVKVDVRVTPKHIEKKVFDINFDTFDVPRSEFEFAADVWKKCRENDEYLDLYGYGKSKECTGLWYIRNKMMHDLAALNKQEMLPWDGWGYMYFSAPHQEITSSLQLKDLDKVSKLIKGSDIDVATLSNYLDNNPNLKVPSIVTAYDKYCGPMSVELKIL